MKNWPTLHALLDVLGMAEEPMGLFYTDTRPARGHAPKAQISLEKLSKEDTGEIHWNSCVLGKMRRARREQVPAYFDHEHYGCLGGAFFMGLKSHYAAFEPALISTGTEGMEGERYVSSPEIGKAMYDGFQPPEATDACMVIQPLQLFGEREHPEIVVFFPDRAAMIGLNALTVFLTGDPDAVRMPFGMGCCSLVSWPRRYRAEGKMRAVISGFDINCLKYLKQNELTYAVPFELFLEMLEKWPESMLGTRAWKRIRKSTDRIC